MMHRDSGHRHGSGRRGLRLLLALGAFAAVAGSAPLRATAGGFNLYEVGSPDTGLAGAGYAARAQDPSTLFTNPAGMTRLAGSRFLFGLQPAFGDIDFEADRKTSVEGSEGGNPGGWLPGGSTFYVHDCSPDLRLGCGLFSYFGSTIDYGRHWAGRYHVESVTLTGLTLMPAAAYRICDQFSVGAGLNAMNGILSEDVAVNNIADRLGDGKLTVEDTTWGFGGNFGVLYEPTPATRFGLTYMTSVDLDFEDSPEFRNVGPGLAGILERPDFRSLSLDMTVPQSLMASAYHELDDRFALLGNVGWQDWSRFGRIGVEVASANPQSLTVKRNYQDTFNFAVGLQYRPAPEWVLSTGAAYDTAMVKHGDRTVDAPVGATLRLGLGAEYEISDSCTLGFAYELIYSGDLPVDQGKEGLAGRVSGEYRNLKMHVFTISLVWRL